MTPPRLSNLLRSEAEFKNKDLGQVCGGEEGRVSPASSASVASLYAGQFPPLTQLFFKNNFMRPSKTSALSAF